MLYLIIYILQLLLILAGIILLGYGLYSMWFPNFSKPVQRFSLIIGFLMLFIGIVPSIFSTNESDPVSIRMVGEYRQLDDPKIFMNLLPNGSYTTNCSDYNIKSGFWSAKTTDEKLVIVTLLAKNNQQIDQFTVDWFQNALQLHSETK